MPQFTLFRVLVTIREQGGLFTRNELPSATILRLLRLKPSVSLREGITWHVGNLFETTGAGLMFAFGRTSRTTRERYNEATQNFVSERVEDAPYTFVLFDSQSQVLAISHKSAMSPSPTNTANQLTKLLNDVLNTGGASGKVIQIVTINDPSSFLSSLSEAYIIKKLTFEFGSSNPFDADEDIQKPLQRYFQEIDATEGQTTVKGENLNKAVAEDIVKATAATGNDATARIKQGAESPVTTIKLRGNPATLFVEDVETEEGRSNALTRLREVYLSIRHSSDDQNEP